MNRITKEERKEVPTILAGAALRAAIEKKHEKHLAGPQKLALVTPELAQKISQLLDGLFNSFRATMKQFGIEIGNVRVAWRPSGEPVNYSDTLGRVQLVIKEKTPELN